ncbi:hypothetical protein RHSIM_Rhsim07G0086800 [Rhododendron simsii]|uniref:Uncharacterized protein n=1 Tax=Rhododendron simsii TaxID=118357 RepID=A0A834GR08_RHOSS|nr:hypothetical protein RHSIM_Rhsim07G0086800 [Rhododendron simsii]
MDTFRFLKYWKTHGVFPVNACSTPRMTITSTIPTVSHHHPSSTDISPDEDHKTKHETIVSTGDDDSDGENERDEFFKFTEPIDLYFKANEESRSSAVKSAMKLRAMMWKLKKSKGDEAEKIEFDDSVLTTANQTQRKLTTAELRMKEVTKYEKLTQTPGSLRLVRTPGYQNKEEVTKFEKLSWTPSALRLARTPSYRNEEEVTKFEKLAWTPSALRLVRMPSYRNEEEVTKFEKLAWTPNLLRLVRTPGYQKKEEVTKSEKQHISKESGPNQTRVSSDLVQKYIEKVKPMYIGVSKRYNEKKVRLASQLRVKSPRETRSGQSPPSKSYTRKSTVEKRRSRQHEMTEAPPLPVVLKNWKQGNLPASLRLGRKNVGKGRSASSGLTQEKRRDDSVLEKEDGIQSAILHCKRSLNGSRDSESSENCSEEPEETSTGDGPETEVEMRL